MRQRPGWTIFLGLVFLMIAISLPVQIMFIYGHGVDELGAVFEKLTFLNILVMAAALTCAVLVWKASPLSRQAVPAFLALVAVNNFFVGYYATDFSMWTTVLATVGLVTLNLPLLHPRMQEILMHPEKRWWLCAERRRLDLPVTIDGTRLTSLKARTFDVSLSGAFVPDVHDVSVGDWITVRMKFGITQIRCQAKVVRRSEPKGIYPGGVGVQFVNMSWRERRDLRRCLQRGYSPF